MIGKKIWFKSEKTINPYAISIKEIINRIIWDINPESWLSRERMSKIKDNYVGRSAIILCNGPSLLRADFDQIKSSGVFVFGLNKINLIFEKVGFNADCVVAVNSHVIRQNIDFFNTTKNLLFIDSNGIKFGVNRRKNVNFLHSANFPGKFAQDCSMSVFQGYTVTYVAIQLAFHMGFKSVALVGCDHKFSTKGPENKEVISGAVDFDHFDPSYFSDGMKWHLPDLFQSELAYRLALHYYKANNRILVNATCGGELEVFPRVTLSGFLNDD